jgi:zinc transport system substrate-binding protein
MGFLWVAILTSYFGIALGGAEPKLNIVTSFLPAYCFTVAVAGDLAEVENLTAGVSEVHDFQLEPAQLKRISQADIVVINGLSLESWMEKILRSGLKPSATIVRLSEGLQKELITSADSGGNGWTDPHIWLDPELARHAVSNIASALGKVDPAHRTNYGANAIEYAKRLERLEQTIREKLKPVAGSPLVTYHDSFRYFARRFHLQIAGVVEETPEVPPSPKYLSALLRTIRRSGVKALFTEPGGNNRLAKQIARDLGIGLAELDPIETGNTRASAYEEAMLKNARTLVENLK